MMDQLVLRNGVSTGSIESKMGIKGSATCVLNFDNAVGYIIGPKNKGLKFDVYNDEFRKNSSWSSGFRNFRNCLPEFFKLFKRKKTRKKQIIANQIMEQIL